MSGNGEWEDGGVYVVVVGVDVISRIEVGGGDVRVGFGVDV